MTTLVLVNKPISTLSDGYDLRVWNLCRALAELEPLISICVSMDGMVNTQTTEVTLRSSELFVDEVTVAIGRSARPSWRRHVRWREDMFFRLAYPDIYREVVLAMRNACLHYSIERLVVFGSNLAEFTLPFRGKKILFDVCDSVVLTQERAMRYRAMEGAFENVKGWIALQRWKQTERRLPRWFSHVTTISDADSRAIAGLAGHKGRVTTIPNGVALDRLVIGERSQSAKRGVAFWGNLSFEPNREALRFFFTEIYLPYLRDSNIECCIVGKNADPWLIDLSKKDKHIHIKGYAEDLGSAICEYPIMVNPMVIGSGMKNKVLEAFALGMGVVSTSLGMEAISGSINNEHFLEANTAEKFALSIKRLLDNPEECVMMGERARKLVGDRYSWSAVSSKWVAIFKELREDRG